MALCGRRESPRASILTVHKIVTIPYSACRRDEYRITWPVELVQQLIGQAAAKGMGILKIHSHPGGYDRFSVTDDTADNELFHPSTRGRMTVFRTRVLSCFLAAGFSAGFTLRAVRCDP